jgi:hypothetical protein
MFIRDLFENDLGTYRDERKDQSGVRMGELRKTRLTLAQIKRLRMMNDVRKFEAEKKIEKLSKQYKPAAAAGAVPGL